MQRYADHYTVGVFYRHNPSHQPSTVAAAVVETNTVPPNRAFLITFSLQKELCSVFSQLKFQSNTRCEKYPGRKKARKTTKKGWQIVQIRKTKKFFTYKAGIASACENFKGSTKTFSNIHEQIPFSITVTRRPTIQDTSEPKRITLVGNNYRILKKNKVFRDHNNYYTNKYIQLDELPKYFSKSCAFFLSKIKFSISFCDGTTTC